MAKAVNFDLLYSIRCVFDCTAVLTCIAFYFVQLSCMWTTVEISAQLDCESMEFI